MDFSKKMVDKMIEYQKTASAPSSAEIGVLELVIEKEGKIYVILDPKYGTERGCVSLRNPYFFVSDDGPLPGGKIIFVNGKHTHPTIADPSTKTLRHEPIWSAMIESIFGIKPSDDYVSLPSEGDLDYSLFNTGEQGISISSQCTPVTYGAYKGCFGYISTEPPILVKTNRGRNLLETSGINYNEENVNRLVRGSYRILQDIENTDTNYAGFFEGFSDGKYKLFDTGLKVIDLYNKGIPPTKH